MKKDFFKTKRFWLGVSAIAAGIGAAVAGDPGWVDAVVDGIVEIFAATGG